MEETLSRDSKVLNKVSSSTKSVVRTKLVKMSHHITSHHISAGYLQPH